MSRRDIAIDHILFHCGSIREGERLLLLCNPQTKDMAAAFAERAGKRIPGVHVEELEFSGNHGQEPSPAVAQYMCEAELTVSLCVFSLAHSEARKKAAEHGGRFLSLPMYSWDLLEDDAVMIDYRARRVVVEKVANALTNGSRARVTSSAGTDLQLDLTGRRGNAAPGYVEKAGDLGSPPDVEANIAPIENATEGVIVVDGSVTAAEIGVVKEPIRLDVRSGKVSAVAGKDAKAARALENLLGESSSARRVVAELGIGLNPEAKLTGVMLTDEGALGCVHFGLGSNTTIGGKNYAGFHLDVVVRDARLEVDGRAILDKGAIL